MNPYKLREIYKYLTRAKKADPELPNVFPASKAPIPAKTQTVEEMEAINAFIRRERQQKAGGGMLVQPSADGSRPGYSGDAIKLPDSPDAGTKSLGGGVYEVTSKKGFKTYYAKVRDKKKSFGKDKEAAENFVKEVLAKPDDRKLKKSVIDIQSESGTLLEQPKYKANLTKALDEVTALQEKGYGNIDEIVKKYQKIFTQKVGSKTKTGKTVKTGVGSTEYKAITFAIREHAKKLNIQAINNSNVIKALDAYSKIKNPKRGDIPKILKKYNAPEGTFNKYLQEDKLNLRKKIPLQFGSEAEKKKYYYRLRRDAINEFSSKKFETFLSAPETALVQKSHLGDLYNQYVRTGNLGYAPNLINQETLKDVDAILKEYNEKINQLLKDKPSGYIKEVDRLNRQGTDLAAATQGFKKFTGRDPLTGKEFTINFSKPGQELDPTEIFENKKLSDLATADKPMLKTLKEDAIERAKLNKKETKVMDKKITSEVKKVLASFGDGTCAVQFGKGNKDGGRIGYATGPASLDNCIASGARNFNDGKFKTADQVQDAAKLLSGGKNVLRAITKYGIIPEVAFVAGESLFRTALGEEPLNALKKSIDSFTFGATDFTSGIEAEKFGKFSNDKLAVDKFRNSQTLVNSLQNKLANLKAITDQGGEGYVGDLSSDIQMTQAQLQTAEQELQKNYVNPDLVQFIDKRGQEIADTQMAKSNFAKQSLKDQMEGIPGIRDYTDTESTRIFPVQPSQTDLNLDLFPSFSDAGYFMNLKTSDAINLAQAYRAQGENVSAKDILTYRDELKNAPLSELAKTYGDEQIYGTQGADALQPLAGGGIAKLAGVSSGPPPVSGPNPQGLLSLKNRVRNY